MKKLIFLSAFSLLTIFVKAQTTIIVNAGTSTGGGGTIILPDYAALRAVATPSLSVEYIVFVNGKENKFRYDSSDHTSADDSAMVFRAGAYRFPRVFGNFVTPEYFGAVGDGIADDTWPVQKAINWTTANAYRGYKLVKTGHYNVTHMYLPLTMPANPLGISDITLIIDGQGQGVISNTGANTIFSRMPTSQTDANSAIQNYNIWFKDMRFVGDNTTGSSALKLGAFYGAKITGCKFWDFDTAVVATFWLKGNIDKNFFTNNKSVAILANSGADEWSGGTTGNSAFNVNSVSENRIFNESGAHASIKMLAGANNHLDNNVIEGAAARYAIYVDDQGSTVSKDNTVNGVHFEANGGTIAHQTNFYIRQAEKFTVSNIRMTYPDTLFDIPTSYHGGHYLFDGIDYLGGPPVFNAHGSSLSGVNIEFRNLSLGGQTTIYNTANWVGGVVPDDVTFTGSKAGGGGLLIASNTNITIQPGYNQSRNNQATYWGGNFNWVTDNYHGLGGYYNSAGNRPIVGWFGTVGVRVDTTGAIGFSSTTPGAMDVGFTRAALGVFGIIGTGAVYLPSGTTAQRPPSALSGYFRYNSTTGAPEYYSGGQWNSLGFTYTGISGTYTALTTDQIIGVVYDGSPITVTLPTASTMTGRTITVKDEGGNASTHNIVVSRAGGDVIDGATTKTISTDYGVLNIYSNGSSWFTK